MKKQLIIIGIIAILVTVGLSGCNSTEEKIIGKWQGEMNSGEIDTCTFYRNGSAFLTYSNPSYSEFGDYWTFYTIAEDKLIITETVYKFTFSNDDRTLTLTPVDEGNTSILTKQ